MKQVRKIYDRAFKKKEVQLSYGRHNISELARKLGVITPQLYDWRKELSPILAKKPKKITQILS
ncbi:MULTISPECIES: transposase [unclassified Flavobacterium]|jgi:transposase|uniref:transposase n=1 Tax=unclassified Flavobacterium TaxID=196869 RepID=UPI0039C88886